MSAAAPLRGAAKGLLLPRGRRVRRLPLGIARGVSMEIDFAHQTRLYLGLYETELNAHLRRLARFARACFDVGGNVGYDALVLAKLTGGSVLSFESDASLCERMRANFRANPALAPRLAGRQALVAAETDAAEGRLALDDAARGQEGFVPDLIKIDVEGAELDALRGARELLAERRPHLVVETHGPELERSCADFLRGFGYAPLVVERRRWLADRRPLAFNRWLVAEGR